MTDNYAELIKELRRGLRKPPKHHIKSSNNVWAWIPPQPDLPAPPAQPSSDWDGHNVLTTPKYQGTCSACTAFAVSTTIEASMRIAHLGDQRIVDPGFLHVCVANKTCNQGVDLTPMINGIHVSGFTCSPPGAPFPYPQQSCPAAARVPLSMLKPLAGPNMAKAELLKRPIVSEMYIWNDFLKQFGSQTYNPNGVGQVYAHTVCVIGYSAAGWHIQNSFGPSWGSGGKITIPYNECGLFSLPPANQTPTDAWTISA